MDASGQDEVHRAAVTDQSREPDRTEVDERHAEAAAEDPEHGSFGHDAQIAPECELASPGDCVALDGCDDWFGQSQPRWTHRPIAVLAAHATIAGGIRLEVGARAEVSAGAGENGDVRVFVAVELTKRGREALRCRGINGVPHFGPLDLDDRDSVHASI
jgi:hypothetical protein